MYHHTIANPARRFTASAAAFGSPEGTQNEGEGEAPSLDPANQSPTAVSDIACREAEEPGPSPEAVVSCGVASAAGRSHSEATRSVPPKAKPTASLAGRENGGNTSLSLRARPYPSSRTTYAGSLHPRYEDQGTARRLSSGLAFPHYDRVPAPSAPAGANVQATSSFLSDRARAYLAHTRYGVAPGGPHRVGPPPGAPSGLVEDAVASWRGADHRYHNAQHHVAARSFLEAKAKAWPSEETVLFPPNSTHSNAPRKVAHTEQSANGSLYGHAQRNPSQTSYSVSSGPSHWRSATVGSFRGAGPYHQAEAPFPETKAGKRHLDETMLFPTNKKQATSRGQGGNLEQAAHNSPYTRPLTSHATCGASSWDPRRRNAPAEGDSNQVPPTHESTAVGARRGAAHLRYEAKATQKRQPEEALPNERHATNPEQAESCKKQVTARSQGGNHEHAVNTSPYARPLASHTTCRTSSWDPRCRNASAGGDSKGANSKQVPSFLERTADCASRGAEVLRCEANATEWRQEEEAFPNKKHATSPPRAENCDQKTCAASSSHPYHQNLPLGENPKQPVKGTKTQVSSRGADSMIPMRRCNVVDDDKKEMKWRKQPDRKGKSDRTIRSDQDKLQRMLHALSRSDVERASMIVVALLKRGKNQDLKEKVHELLNESKQGVGDAGQVVAEGMRKFVRHHDEPTNQMPIGAQNALHAVTTASVFGTDLPQATQRIVPFLGTVDVGKALDSAKHMKESGELYKPPETKVFQENVVPDTATPQTKETSGPFTRPKEQGTFLNCATDSVNLNCGNTLGPLQPTKETADEPRPAEGRKAVSTNFASKRTNFNFGNAPGSTDHMMKAREILALRERRAMKEKLVSDADNAPGSTDHMMEARQILTLRERRATKEKLVSDADQGLDSVNTGGFFRSSMGKEVPERCFSDEVHFKHG